MIVLGVSLWYFSYVFRISEGTFFTVGLGDWIDPYFMNYLLEHWYTSLLHLTDPASPPIFFPVQGTLGYSHGLVLYAPFYAAARLFLHPFAAYNAAIFLVLAAGTWCLYVLFRRFAGLGFFESLLLAAFFASSENIVNTGTGGWAQRASVFLMPPILLMAIAAARMADGRRRVALAWLAGLLAALLFTHDFYTGQLGVLVFGLLAVGLLITRRAQVTSLWRAHRRYVVALGVGAALGSVIFLWIYLDAYLEHPRFPENQLSEALVPVDPSQWHTFSDVVDRLVAYPSARSFSFSFLAVLLAWLPWFRVSRDDRWYGVWFLLVSVLVLLIPLQWHGHSIWKAIFAPLPGFSAIRDPKRIVFIYELAVVLVTAAFLVRLPKASALRVIVGLLLLFFLAIDRNPERFEFNRPVSVFARWVAAPIQANAGCTSFFIKGASADYMSRSGHMWTLYAVDSAFIGLAHRIPTLNGYSAWGPDDWGLANPQEPEYLKAVDRWIDTHQLHGVCALDIEARTMRPYRY